RLARQREVHRDRHWAGAKRQGRGLLHAGFRTAETITGWHLGATRYLRFGLRKAFNPVAYWLIKSRAVCAAARTYSSSSFSASVRAGTAALAREDILPRAWAASRRRFGSLSFKAAISAFKAGSPM